MFKSTFGEVSVGEGRKLGKEIVTERVDAVFVDDLEWIDNIAKSFAHFLAVDGEVAVNKDGFGERELGRKEEGRPVDGVKAENAFTDNMEVGGPPLAVFLIVPAEANARLIDVKGVEPDIDYLGGIVGDRDAPVFGSLVGAGDANIRESGEDKVQGFGFAIFRNDLDLIGF